MPAPEPTHDDLRFEAWSDAELIGAARAVHSEIGCWAWVAVPLAPLLLGLLHGRAAAVMAFLGALAACVAITSLRGFMPRVRRGAAAARAFDRRWGFEPLESLEAEATGALDENPELEAVVLFVGHALPQGLHYFCRIELGASPQLLSLRAPTLYALTQDRARARELARVVMPLSAATVEPLASRIRALTPQALIDPGPGVVDGFPCEARIVRRDAPPLSAAANLGGMTPERAAHPTLALLAQIAELNEKHGSAR